MIRKYASLCVVVSDGKEGKCAKRTAVSSFCSFLKGAKNSAALQYCALVSSMFLFPLYTLKSSTTPFYFYQPFTILHDIVWIRRLLWVLLSRMVGPLACPLYDDDDDINSWTIYFQNMVALIQ